jgi:glycosyltransferase involved in cell wall biosynthesis
VHAEEIDRSGYPSYVATRFDDAVDAYSVVSNELKERMVEYGVAEKKLHVIHLGVDPAVFDPGHTEPAIPMLEEQFPILYPHRLTDQKDPLLMVTIMKALREAGSSATIHVVGEGDLRPALEAAVDGAGLRDRVVFHGAHADVAGWYRATKATLLTSRFEGIPLVVYEAMAMGHPVVAADVNGTHELLNDDCGFLIRPRESVAAYVAAIERLEREPGLAERQGVAGRQRILEHFTVEDMAAGHLALYRQLAADYLVGTLP